MINRLPVNVFAQKVWFSATDYWRHWGDCCIFVFSTVYVLMVFINGLNGTIVTSFILNIQNFCSGLKGTRYKIVRILRPLLVRKSFWTKPLDSSSSCLQPNPHTLSLSLSLVPPSSSFSPLQITFLIWRGYLKNLSVPPKHISEARVRCVTR